jgi:hypothetical protein
MEITNGVGNGNKLKVDAANRAHTLATSQTRQEYATERGDSYNLNSGLVTLSDASEQGILYLKNNEDRDLKLSAFVIILGPSTGGSAADTTRVRIIKNPTTGTLISEATDASPKSNRNFGSTDTLTADVYKGDGSATVTDGSVHIDSLVSPGNRIFFGSDEVLTKGDSVAITLEPNDSNTSMKCMAAISCNLKDSNA